MIYLQAAGGGDLTSMMLMFGMIAVVFFFFIIRPQSKRQKDMKKFRESLEKGQKIVTIGGVHGKIVELKDTTAVIEVEGGNRLKIERSAISLEYTTGSGSSELQQADQQGAKK